MRVIFLRVKERQDLHPLLIGLLQQQGWRVVSPSSDPEYSDGYYCVTFMTDEEGEAMVYTYERGSLNKEVYKEKPNAASS